MFAMGLNIFLTILWALSLGLIGWSMAGSITTACTTSVWGNSAGITACRSYKALFVFTITGFVSHVAATWLDIIVRRRENRFGKYGAMTSNHALDDSGAFDVKMDDRHETAPALQEFNNLPPTMHGAHGSYGGSAYERNAYAHGGDAQSYYDAPPDVNHQNAPRDRFGDHDQISYQGPAEQTRYDPAMYR